MSSRSTFFRNGSRSPPNRSPGLTGVTGNEASMSEMTRELSTLGNHYENVSSILAADQGAISTDSENDGYAPTIIRKSQTLETKLLVEGCEKSTEASDEKTFVKHWKKQLREIIKTENEKYTSFLQASRPFELPINTSTGRSFNTLLHKIGETGNATFVRRSTVLDISAAEIVKSLDSELGLSEGVSGIGLLRSGIHKSFTIYNECLKRLFGYDEELSNKIGKIEKINNKVLSLLELDESEMTPEFLESIRCFVRESFDKYGVAENYKNFCKEYMRFHLLRQIITPPHSVAEEKVIHNCSICTVSEVGFVFTPCGHTFCGNCMQKQRQQCYICRSSITGRVKLYFT